MVISGKTVVGFRSSWAAGAIVAGIMAAGVVATKLPNFIPGGVQHVPGVEVKEILGE